MIIPQATSTVSVKVISPNRVLGVPANIFLTPDIKGSAYSDTPCLAFLVEQDNGGSAPRRLLFDLGIRKDWTNCVPTVVDAIKQMNIKIQTPLDVVDQLKQIAIDLASIEAIVLSHWHFDHIGDPSLFPPSTKLVVGPGFENLCIPGYPINPSSPIPETAFLNRRVEEISFSASPLKIGSFNAVDYFGDGSFYLLQTPGHAVGHISALARVHIDEQGDSSFVLLAGDVCHHAGELRPSHGVSLPRDIPDLMSMSCYSLAKAAHPLQAFDRPYYQPADGPFNDDTATMKQTIEDLVDFDADPNCFVLLAHDNTLLETIDLAPKSVNSWKSKGWKHQSRWKFLSDFVP